MRRSWGKDCKPGPCFVLQSLQWFCRQLHGEVSDLLFLLVTRVLRGVCQLACASKFHIDPVRAGCASVLPSPTAERLHLGWFFARLPGGACCRCVAPCPAVGPKWTMKLWDSLTTCLILLSAVHASSLLRSRRHTAQRSGRAAESPLETPPVQGRLSGTSPSISPAEADTGEWGRAEAGGGTCKSSTGTRSDKTIICTFALSRLPKYCIFKNKYLPKYLSCWGAGGILKDLN